MDVAPAGTGLFGLSRLGLSRFGLGGFGLAVSVWGHFGHNISVHKQLLAFVYLNIGRRNVTLAGVIPTPF